MFIIRLLRPRQGQPECNLSTGGNRVRDSRLLRNSQTQHLHILTLSIHHNYLYYGLPGWSQKKTTSFPQAGGKKISPHLSSHIKSLPCHFAHLLPFLAFLCRLHRVPEELTYALTHHINSYSHLLDIQTAEGEPWKGTVLSDAARHFSPRSSRPELDIALPRDGVCRGVWHDGES